MTADLPGLEDYDLLVTLKPGDIVVLRRKSGAPFRTEDAKRLGAELKGRAPGVEWLILDQSVDLTVMRPA